MPTKPYTDPREQPVRDEAELDPSCVCATCGEPVYFVPGLRGPERWKHTRTALASCSPICAACGEPAIRRIGHSTIGGDGYLTFVTTCWLCARCAAKRLVIERT